ncbi:MAG: pyridoxal 5'-phosphate synthase glutaminase subunit PdxT [Janthinobacterium lividum]
MNNELLIGVLALQGAYQSHVDMFAQLGARMVLIRQPEELQGLDGLVIPGGESSTFLRHLGRDGFFDVLKESVQKLPTFGTCAGAILLAQQVSNPSQESLGAMDIDIERNAYGRQRDSTILELETSMPGPALEMVFIRAPRISRVGPKVEVLARRNGDPVLVKQDNFLAATFHPELSQDSRVHQLFLDMTLRYRVCREVYNPT